MLFNLILFLCDGLILGTIARHTKIWICLAFGALFALAGICLGAGLAEDLFGFVRLAAYGIFLHTPVVWFGTAVIWRKQRKLLAVGLASSAALLLGIAGYAFLIEPYWLEITHYEIVSPKIKRPLRIVAIADLQTDRFGSHEKRVFDEALAQKPDIILLAGDYLQTTYAKTPQLSHAVNTYLHEIGFAAPLGVYAVQGNIDFGDWQNIFANLDVNGAENRRQFALDDLSITCLSLSESFLTVAVENPEPRKFHLVLGHSPNFALGKIDADLLVAGHTHGGQVRFPFVGPLTTGAHIPRSWAAGMTDLPGGGKLLVSRGTGMERGTAPRLRFLCRPELAVIDLTPGGKG